MVGNKIKTLEDIHDIVLKLEYNSSSLELVFCPLFEVDEKTYHNLFKQILCKAFSPNHSFDFNSDIFTYQFMNVKCYIKSINP